MKRDLSRVDWTDWNRERPQRSKHGL